MLAGDIFFFFFFFFFCIYQETIRLDISCESSTYCLLHLSERHFFFGLALYTEVNLQTFVMTNAKPFVMTTYVQKVLF